MNGKTAVSFLLAVAIAAASPFSHAAVGGGDIEYKPKGAGAVVFRHEYHVSIKGMKCKDCHTGKFQMGGASYKMDMAMLTKGQFCGSCHDGSKGFDLKAAENCKRCHQD
jgi:c(7)-type cytochrome triheme protein